MNRLFVFLTGIVSAFGLPWLGIAAYSYLNFAALHPVEEPKTGASLPPQLSGLDVIGERIYAREGCVSCHTQQIRPNGLAEDIAQGLGTRSTVARDFLHDQPAFLGSRRIGPDLTNVGIRHPDPGWLHRHLYEPATVIPASICPSFRFLYEARKITGQTSSNAIEGLKGPHAPRHGWEVIPTNEAMALVHYLLSLKHDYPLPEAPKDSTAP